MAGILKNIAFAIILLMMILPGLQGYFGIFEEKPLHGAFESAEEASLTAGKWFRGEFQEAAENRIGKRSGFHNSLVRMYNQLDYSLFGKLNAEGLVMGNNGQLYEYDYIRAWMGEDFIGEQLLDKKLRRFRFLQQHLKEKYGTDLVLVLEPGKASVYPDDIPARYKHKPVDTTNYEYIRDRAKDLGINLIDFNAWFMAMKDTASWPLFPKQGTHWSEYAMWYAADSLLHYIRDIRDITLGAVVRDSMVISSRLQSTDYDAGQTLNLLCSLPHSPMPYPVYHFNTEGITHKPNVLAIADSYYWNIFNTRIPEKLFNNQAFWYFYKKVYPDSYHGDKLVKDLDLRAEVEKQDVIFFMSTERFLYKFDRGFVDDLWEIYGLRSSSDRLTQYKTGILNLDPWFSEVISEAGREGESLGKMLELEARHLLWKNEPERFYALYGPAPVANDIRKNPAWFADVRRRAANNNISVEERLIEEATYMLRNKYPGAFQEYESVKRIMGNIRSDSAWLVHITEKAERYFMTVDEVIRADAEYVFSLEKK
jgi:hypothetical protein